MTSQDLEDNIMTSSIHIDSLPQYWNEYVSKDLLEEVGKDGLSSSIQLMPDGHVVYHDRPRLTAWRRFQDMQDCIDNTTPNSIEVTAWDELSEDEQLQCIPRVENLLLTIDSKFDFNVLWHFDGIMDYVEGRKSNDINTWMDTLKPYWEFATRTAEGDRLPILQIHARVCKDRMQSLITECERGEVMARLHHEEAMRLGHGDPNRLYLHYPHKEVDKEVLRQEFRMKICAMDYDALQRASNLAGVDAFTEGQDERIEDNIVDTERMVVIMEVIRQRLRRRYL